MQQYREDHKEDPVRLSKEGERLKKLRAHLKFQLEYGSQWQEGSVNENDDEIVCSKCSVIEGSSLSFELSSDLRANGLSGLSDNELPESFVDKNGDAIVCYKSANEAGSSLSCELSSDVRANHKS
jgi:hypothetical protein